MRYLPVLFVAGLLLNSVACASPTSDAATQNAAVTEASPASEPAPISNFETVRPGLYRGGHPDAAGLDYLKKLGVRRIVDLEVGDFIEAFPWDIDKELDGASAREMTELRYPMSAFEAAASDRFDSQMNEMVELFKTATIDDPVYVHCKHGQDRTGLVVGLERVLDEGWTPKAAHDEMVRIGFHTGFLGLEEYFENKTGWKD